MKSVAPPASPLILFDGECGFCAQFVRFVLKRDRGLFRFAPLQSETGQDLMARYHLPAPATESAVLIDGNTAFTQSTAALRICQRLSGAWPLCAVFMVVPRSWRDALYRAVARRRHRIDTGRPRDLTPAERTRFLP